MTPRYISLILNQRNLFTAEVHNPTAQDIGKTLNVVRLLLSELQQHFLSEQSFVFTVRKPLRFSNYAALPGSQGTAKTARFSQDGFSGLVKPNSTCSVQKPQTMQTTTISKQQHPLPLVLHCPWPVLELVTAGAPINTTEAF